MEEIVDISVKCPNRKCQGVIKFRKKKVLKSLEICCPCCKEPIHVDFDISIEPQGYKAFLVNKDNGRTNESHKKDTIYNKKRNNTPHKSYDEIDEEVIDAPIHTHKKRKLKDRIFLTHVRLWGLIKDKYRLGDGTTVVGRYDEDYPSDISLKGDNMMSRQSIAITIEADEYGFDFKLRVQNATNPIKVNGKKINVGEELLLEFGDVIQLGNSKLVFDSE